MIIGVCTPHADPHFSSAVPEKVKAQSRGRIVDVPWLSAGAVNAESPKGNGYYFPDLNAYKRLAQRAANLLKDQPGPKVVQLDMEDVPLEPGHTGESAEHVTRGAPTWRMWRGERPDKKARTPAEGRERVAYGYRFFAPCAAAVAAIVGVEVSVYATDPVWFDGPPPKTWEEECDYRTLQAVRDNYLLRHVDRLCVDVYPWPAADGLHLALWNSDFDAKMRLIPPGVPAYPELYCFWNDTAERVYVGDDMLRHMLDGCRLRGFDFATVFEPPPESYDVLVEAARA